MVWKGIADFDWRISLIVAGAAIVAIIHIRDRA